MFVFVSVSVSFPFSVYLSTFLTLLLTHFFVYYPLFSPYKIGWMLLIIMLIAIASVTMSCILIGMMMGQRKKRSEYIVLSDAGKL